MAPDSDKPDDHWDEIFKAEDFGDKTVPATVAQPDSAAAPQPAPQPAAEPAAQSRRALRESENRGAKSSRSPRDRPREGYHENGSLSRPPKKKSRRKGWIIALSIVAVLLAGGAVGVSWAWGNYEDQIRKVMGWEIPIDYEGAGHGEASIVIRSGDGGEVIAASLTEAGVTKTPEAFYKLLLVQDPQVVFFPGQYLLKQEMSAQAALDALQDPANKVEISVLIREGQMIDQTMAALSEGTGIPLADFEAAALDPTVYGVPAEAPSLEGYLFPARYNFEPDGTAAGVLQTLVNRTFQSLDAAGVAPTDRHRVLTMAALIQREAGSNQEDFYKVSRVFQNRLDSGWLLQSDATVAYGADTTHTVWTTPEDRADESNKYNTYANPGLPVGPIGAAGDLAIDAALHPADGPWFFFVPINLETGETVFSVTQAEHEQAVEKLRKWCRETQSPNCD